MIVVSISVVTFNHKKYIKKCLEGILMQQTNFEIEILLGEDESTDGTREICKEYSEKYPDKIKLYLRSRKDVIYIGKKPTGRFNFIENLKNAKGKYIAICEGDDYWTDPFKLQKQVDFLECNPEFVIATHNSNVVDANGNIMHLFNKVDIPSTTDITYILKNPWYISTASIMVRKKNIHLPKWFYNGQNGDYILQLLATAEGGLVYYSKDIMSSYRVHDKGRSIIFNEKNVFDFSMLYINKSFNNYTRGKYRNIIGENIRRHSNDIIERVPIKSREFWKANYALIYHHRGLTKSQINNLIERFKAIK